MATIKHYTKSEIVASASTISINSYCRLGVSFDRQPDEQTGLDTYFNENRKDFIFTLNQSSVAVGKTHIYELTQPIFIHNLVFNNGVPDTIGIDIIYENEEEAD